jgi:diaminohydroxyphosphoribosylaminopyrimidine deaminase/5-amino-6-(5-phosphoribosylamino)uracil reductase
MVDGNPAEQPRWMDEALRLAALGDYGTSPNPMVGAVVVKDGRPVGRGYHRRAGEAHAEVLALDQAGDLARGAELWVTLEPCCTQGRTGPCTARIIEAGVARVNAAMIDPNPAVSGRGVEVLRAAGIEVALGAAAKAAQRLVETYAVWVSTGLPFLTLKLAMSLDGRVATASGRSKWITSEAAREEGHRLRHAHDVILVGSQTVLADDPVLTNRSPGEGRRQPLRVVLDGRLRTPPDARMLREPGGAVLIFTTSGGRMDRRLALERAGAEVVEVPQSEGSPSIREVLRRLAGRGVTSVLVEGGPTVLASLFAERLGNRIVSFMAPTVIGGKDAPGPFGGIGAATPDAGWHWHFGEVERIGADLKVTAEVA